MKNKRLSLILSTLLIIQLILPSSIVFASNDLKLKSPLSKLTKSKTKSTKTTKKSTSKTKATKETTEQKQVKIVNPAGANPGSYFYCRGGW